MSAAHADTRSASHSNVRPMKQRYDFDDVRRAVRHDKRITFAARCYFEDVCELAEEKGYCWAGDKHFEEVYGVTDRSVRNWKSALVEAGYLRIGTVGGSAALYPQKSAAQSAANGSKSKDRKNGSAAEKLFRGAEDSFQKDRNNYSDTKSYITPEGGESGARAHEGCPSDGLGASPRSREEVVAAAGAEGIPAAVAGAAFDHYDAQGWVTGGRHPQPILNRLAKIRQWAARESDFKPASPAAPSGGAAAHGSGASPGPARPSEAEMQRLVGQAVERLPRAMQERYERRHPSEADPELDEALGRELELLLQHWTPEASR